MLEDEVGIEKIECPECFNSYFVPEYKNSSQMPRFCCYCGGEFGAWFLFDLEEERSESAAKKWEKRDGQR